jgi:outer membrane receptor protein involved in Fe transport
VGSATGSVLDRRTFDTTTARLEGGWRRHDRLKLLGGLEWYDYTARYEYSSDMAFEPVLAEAFGKPSSLSRTSDLYIKGDTYGAYASALLSLTPRVLFDVGARWDGQRFGSPYDGNQVSPRLSLQFRRDAANTFRLSWGRFAQTERPDELAVQDGDPSFHPAQRASQLVASLEKRPKSNVLLRLEAYDKHVTTPGPEYENLLDPFALLPELAVDRVRIQPDRSRAYGAELSMRWELPPAWLAWFSYSRSEVRDDVGSKQVPRSWNQEHSLIAGVNWSGGPWGVSANALWHSGWRRNVLEVLADDEVRLLPRNSNGWPDYFSLDLRGTYTRPLATGSVQLFLEIDNLANHSNPCCSDYRALTSPAGLDLTRDQSTWLPRIFLIGASWQMQ